MYHSLFLFTVLPMTVYVVITHHAHNLEGECEGLICSKITYITTGVTASPCMESVCYQSRISQDAFLYFCQ